MEGVLWKNSGGKKTEHQATGGRSRRTSFGNIFGKWERRHFQIRDDGKLCYYRSEAAMMAGKAASEVECRGALITVLEKENAFSIETRERVLSLRAESGMDRSSWIVALMAAGAIDHPLSNRLAAHPVSERRASTSSSARLSAASFGELSVCSNQPSLRNSVFDSSAARTWVQVPTGLRPGDSFAVEVPSGERFNVTVPTGAGEQIEVVIPAHFVPEHIVQTTNTDAWGDGHSHSSLRSDGNQPTEQAKWTLCRRFVVTLERPPGASVGLALAPSKTNHLIITDIPHGGLAHRSNQFMLADMLLTVNGVVVNGLESFMRALDGASGELTFDVQRVEDEDALSMLLEQVTQTKPSRT